MNGVQEVSHKKKLSPAVRAKKARLMKAQHKDPKFRRRFEKALHEYNADPAMKRQKSKALKAQKKNPAFEKARRAGFQRYIARLRAAKKKKDA